MLRGRMLLRIGQQVQLGMKPWEGIPDAGPCTNPVTGSRAQAGRAMNAAVVRASHVVVAQVTTMPRDR